MTTEVDCDTGVVLRDPELSNDAQFDRRLQASSLEIRAAKLSMLSKPNRVTGTIPDVHDHEAMVELGL